MRCRNAWTANDKYITVAARDRQAHGGVGRMTLKIVDVRIGQVGVEASRAGLEKAAPGPFGGIAYALGYKDMFDRARSASEPHALPWDLAKPYRNRFWKKYVTDRMLGEEEKRWRDVGWQALVPFKVPASLPRVHLDSDHEFRSYSEAYAWPTGFGIVWNNWIKPALDIDGLVALLGTIRGGTVPWAGADGAAGTLPMKTLYHQMLDSARDQLWGTQQKGSRSDPITVVSIVQAEADPAAPNAAADALKRLLDGLAANWERPAPLADDRRAASGETIYVADGLRLAWMPGNFLSQSRKRPGNCLHRNLLLASLQVEMLASAARMLAGHKQNDGLPAHYQSTVERVLQGSDGILADDGYSAPHLRLQLQRKPVARALAELRG